MYNVILVSGVQQNESAIHTNKSIFFKCFAFIYLFIYFCLFAISWAAPAAYGGSQARGLIGAVAASQSQSQSNAGSEPRLRPTPQLMGQILSPLSRVRDRTRNLMVPSRIR